MTAPAALLFSAVRAAPGVATGDAVSAGAGGFDALLAQLTAALGSGPTGSTASDQAATGTRTAPATETTNDETTADGSAAPMAAFNGWFGLQPPTVPGAAPRNTADVTPGAATRPPAPAAVDQPLVLPQPDLTGAAKATEAQSLPIPASAPTPTAAPGRSPADVTASTQQPQVLPQPHLTGAAKAMDAQTLPAPAAPLKEPPPAPVAVNPPARPATDAAPLTLPLAPKPSAGETSVIPASVAGAAGQADTADQIAAVQTPLAAAAQPPPVEPRTFRKAPSGESPVKVVAQALAGGATPAGAASMPVAEADPSDADPQPSLADAAPVVGGSNADAADHPVDGFAQTLAGRLEGLASGATNAAAHLRSAPETVNRLVAGIVSKVGGGQATRFDLQLDPLGLGKVDVSVEIGTDGRLMAALNFDNAQAASDLRSRAQELRQALEQAGFTIGDSGLSFDFAGQNSQRDPSGEEAPRSALAGRAFAQALDALQDEAVLPRRFQAQRGLDILI